MPRGLTEEELDEEFELFLQEVIKHDANSDGDIWLSLRWTGAAPSSLLDPSPQPVSDESLDGSSTEDKPRTQGAQGPAAAVDGSSRPEPCRGESPDAPGTSAAGGLRSLTLYHVGSGHAMALC